MDGRSSYSLESIDAWQVKGRAAVICVVNKKTGAVELGTEMSNDLIRVRKPKDEEGDDDGDGGTSAN